MSACVGSGWGGTQLDGTHATGLLECTSHTSSLAESASLESRSAVAVSVVVTSCANLAQRTTPFSATSAVPTS